MTLEPTPIARDVMLHLRRLEQAVCAGEVVKELQYLAPCLGTRSCLSALSLSSLIALAQGHLQDRSDASRDALTGVLDAETFGELLRAHAQRTEACGQTAPTLVVVLTLFNVEPDSYRLRLIKSIARLCARQVAGDDHIGRIGPASIAVLPRNCGLPGAKSVRNRLIAECNAEFAQVQLPLHMLIDLRDVSGKVHDRIEFLVGRHRQAQRQVPINSTPLAASASRRRSWSGRRAGRGLSLPKPAPSIGRAASVEALVAAARGEPTPTQPAVQLELQ